MKRYLLLPNYKYVFLTLLISALLLNSSAQTVRVFSTSGTFTVPSCVTTITVQCWGAGGGGGGAAAASGGAAGSGGGGGGYAIATLTNVSGTYTVTVGAGGTAGNGAVTASINGVAGGNSVFTNGTVTVTGVGGGGGTGQTGAGVGSTVGQGGGGTFVGATGSTYKGGNGALGNNQDNNTGGAGGGGAGSSGNGVTPSQTGNDANGTGGSGGPGNVAGAGGSVTAAYYENGGPGSSIGGGGAGGGGETSGGVFGHGTASGNGGAGADGEVIITYSVSTPTITSVTGSGCVGSTVTIHGTLLTGATSVTIGSTAVSNLSITSTTITGTVAAGTTSGVVTVTTPCGTVTSATAFTVHPVSRVNLGTHSICSGSYSFGGRTYTTSGTYSDTTSSVITGCDSISTITLTIGTTINQSIAHTVCAGGSYNFGGHTYTSSGTYIDTATSAVTGCDSITTLNLTIGSALSQTISQTVCSGGSYNFGGHTYTTSGTYMDTTTSVVSGCDSITTLNLVIGSSLSQTIVQTVCADLGFSFGGHLYNATGFYADTATSTISGCDSITILRLTVHSNPTSTINGYVCGTTGYTFNGNTYTVAGIYTDTLAGAGSNGCDSIVTLNLGVANTTGESVSITATPAVICNGDSAQLCATTGFVTYKWNTGDSTTCLYATSAASYSVTATDTSGCLVSNAFSTSAGTGIAPSIHKSGDTLICSPESTYQWYFNNQAVTGDTSNYIIATQPGQYSVNVVDTAGCRDSSAGYNFTTSIVNLNTGAAISVFPNPLVSGNWSIDLTENLVGGSCEMFDADGRSVFKSTISSRHFEISPNLGKGVYILQINAAGSMYNLKLIKLN